MRNNPVRIRPVSVSADGGHVESPPTDRRRVLVSAAARAAVVAATLAAAVITSAHAQTTRPAPAGDGTTEHFFTVEFSSGRLASITRQQVAAAFASKLAAANIEVPERDFDAAIDSALRKLVNWNGEAPVSMCVPRVCWEVLVTP